MNGMNKLLAGLTLWLSGCISLGVFQGPDVLPEGKTEAGIGIVGGGVMEKEEGEEWLGIAMLELYGRVGVAPKLELGARMTGFPAQEGVVIGSLMAEGKYQLRSTWPLTAVGMGISFSTLPDDLPLTIGLYPAVWIGSSRMFISTRMILMIVGAGEVDTAPWIGSLAGVTLGGRLGSRLNIRPELTFYAPLYEEGPGFLMGGLGLSIRL